MELPYDPAIPGCISKETQTANLKEYMHHYAHCCIIYNIQNMEANQMPIKRWMDKKVVGYVYNELLGCEKKKEWNLTIYNSTDGPGGYYAKWNESVRERQYHMILLICGL